MKSKTGRYFSTWLAGSFVVIAMSVQLATAASLSVVPDRKAIVVGTAITIDARTAPELVGSRGIVVGTCYEAHKLERCALTLRDRKGRNFQLGDGVYESKQGIRIHVQKGAIVRVSTSRGR